MRRRNFTVGAAAALTLAAEAFSMAEFGKTIRLE
jgi:hypothetical protein